MAVVFTLQFDPARIRELSAAYAYRDNAHVLEAGERILRGTGSAADVHIISKWKSPRSSGRVRKNSAHEIEDAIRLAVSALTDRAALAVLVGLKGVDVPVASAVLSAIFPERFTIIDFRALEALGVKRPSPQIDFYLEYLEHCRSLATTHGVSLRDLDRALWQWSSSASK